MLNKLKFNSFDFFKVQFGDLVAFWCSDSRAGHHFWMPYVGTILEGQPNCSGNTCVFDGVFTGMQGVTDVSSYKYCDLGQAC